MPTINIAMDCLVIYYYHENSLTYRLPLFPHNQLEVNNYFISFIVLPRYIIKIKKFTFYWTVKGQFREEEEEAEYKEQKRQHSMRLLQITKFLASNAIQYFICH